MAKTFKNFDKDRHRFQSRKRGKFDVLPSVYYIISILLNREQGNLPAFLPEISPKMGQEA